MSESAEAWSCCRDDGAATVLAVGFEAGRGEARLAELAEQFGPSRFFISQPSRLVSAGHGEGDYLGELLAALGDQAPGVDAVIGHCAGSPLAARLTDRLAAVGRRPLLAVVDPEVVDASAVAKAYLGALASLTGHLDDAERAAATSVVAGGHGIDGLAVPLALAYRQAAEAAARRVGLDAGFVDQLTTRWDRYLAYLVAAARAGDAWAVADLVLLSTDSPSEVGSARETAVLRLDVPGSRLLAYPGAAAALRQALSPVSNG